MTQEHDTQDDINAVKRLLDASDHATRRLPTPPMVSVPAEQLRSLVRSAESMHTAAGQLRFLMRDQEFKHQRIQQLEEIATRALEALKEIAEMRSGERGTVHVGNAMEIFERLNRQFVDACIKARDVRAQLIIDMAAVRGVAPVKYESAQRLIVDKGELVSRIATLIESLKSETLNALSSAIADAREGT